MNKKFLFFTSAAIMCMACPAIAETFPGDGNMLENKTYDNAATYTNTGVYEGDVTADAYYDLNPYTVAAGSYFTGLDNNNAAITAQCISGNYCPGVASTTYDDVNSAFVDDGLETCPTGYNSSDLGASADTQCYRACNIDNMGANGTIANIAHAATLTGNDYYGNVADTCEPATCVAGWHVKSGINIATTIGTGGALTYAYINNNNVFSEHSGVNYGQNFYSIADNDINAFAISYGDKGILHGHGRCSTTQGTITGDYPNNVYSTETTLTDETGQEGAKYCWCQIDGYKPNGGTLQNISSSWVYLTGYYYNNSNCSKSCADYCGERLSNGYEFGLVFRAAILNTIPTSPASCEANTINITWNDASAEDIAATGAATTVYEGDIKTPLKAITKPGKTFVGWKFIKTTNPAPVQGEGD